MATGYNLDQRNPNGSATLEDLDASALIAQALLKETQIMEILDSLREAVSELHQETSE